MNTSLPVFAIVVLLFNGVQSINLKDEDHKDPVADKLFVFGNEAFLKILDNVKIAAETVLRNNEFSRTGNEMEDLWKSLKKLVERIIAKERAKGNRDDFLIAVSIFKELSFMYSDGISAVAEALFSRTSSYLQNKALHGIFKNETMVELWRDVGSQYFPGAPPVYSDPFGFLSYLLSKIVMKPHMVRNLKVAFEVVKIDMDQLYKDAQVAMNLVGQKAMEISALERQTEKNDLAVTLRTVSGLIAFYWDRFLEYTESSPFHNQYIDSVRQWKELRMLRNKCYSETEHQALNWADQRFGNLLNNVGVEYHRWGDWIFGDERFNQSNWALTKMASLYRLPVYEKLCESGLGVSEANNFFRTAYDVLTKLGGEEFMHMSREILNEVLTAFDNEILSITNNFHMTSDTKQPLHHLRTMKKIFFEVWDQYLAGINVNIKKDKVEQALRSWNGFFFYLTLHRQWDEVKKVFIKELIDSGELTQENLDEAQKTLINVTQMVFDKYVKMIDGLDKRISASIEFLRNAMLQTFSATNDALINTLVLMVSD